MPFLNFEEDFLTTEDLLFLAGASGVKGVEDTATGNPVTFETDLAKPLKSLVANFLPVQSGTGDPSPTNIRPITGWTGLNVQHFPKNLLSINRTTSQSGNGIDFTPIKDASNKMIAVNVKGKNTGNNTFFNLNYVKGSTVSIPAGTHTVYGVKTGIRFQAFCIQDGVEKSLLPNGESTFTVPSDATASWLRIKVDSTDDIDVNIYPVLLNSTDEYETLPVTWTTHGIIYGGYVDLVTGEVWKEWEEIASYDGETIPGRWLSDRDVYTAGSTPTTGAQVVYELATPTLITTLTPQQINALKGNNTVWSDGNGDCEVTYFKKG